jgi:hypothetical protein
MFIYFNQEVSQPKLHRLLLNLTQPSNCTPDSNSTGSTQTVSTSSNNLLTTFAIPDTDARSLHGIFPAECATVTAVLGDFDFTEELSQGGTVAGAVFAGDSDFASAVLSHDEFRLYMKAVA